MLLLHNVDSLLEQRRIGTRSETILCRMHKIWCTKNCMQTICVAKHEGKIYIYLFF